MEKTTLQLDKEGRKKEKDKPAKKLRVGQDYTRSRTLKKRKKKKSLT